MNQISLIHNAVRDGRLTPSQAADLLELRREIRRRAARRRAIRLVVRWALLVPLWCWIGRRFRP